MNPLENLGNEISELYSSSFKIPSHIDLNPRNYFLANYQYEILCEEIKEFQDNLDDNHEVGLQLASFGQSILLNVSNIRVF